MDQQKKQAKLEDNLRELELILRDSPETAPVIIKIVGNFPPSSQKDDLLILAETLST